MKNKNTAAAWTTACAVLYRSNTDRAFATSWRHLYLLGFPLFLFPYVY